MKRCVLSLMMALCTMGATAQSRADWMVRLTAGAAFPAGAATGAPELSTSFTSSLRAVVVPHSLLVPIAISLDGVHWLSSPTPDRGAVPIDEGLYVKRALHFPLTVGLWLPLFIPQRGVISDLTVTVGAYWRNLNLQRMAAPGVMDDMEEHGWGLAWKVEWEVAVDRWSIGVSYLGLGNLFGDCSNPPQGTSPVNENGIRRSQPTLDGYGQGFLTVSLGYHLFRSE